MFPEECCYRASVDSLVQWISRFLTNITEMMSYAPVCLGIDPEGKHSSPNIAQGDRGGRDGDRRHGEDGVCHRDIRRWSLCENALPAAAERPYSYQNIHREPGNPSKDGCPLQLYHGRRSVQRAGYGAEIRRDRRFRQKLYKRFHQGAAYRGSLSIKQRNSACALTGVFPVVGGCFRAKAGYLFGCSGTAAGGAIGCAVCVG